MGAGAEAVGPAPGREVRTTASEAGGMAEEEVVVVVVEEEAVAGTGKEAIRAVGMGQLSIPFCQSKMKCQGGKCLALCFSLAKQDPRSRQQTEL